MHFLQVASYRTCQHSVAARSDGTRVNPTQRKLRRDSGKNIAAHKKKIGHRKAKAYASARARFRSERCNLESDSTNTSLKRLSLFSARLKNTSSKYPLAGAFRCCAIFFRGKAPVVFLAQPEGLGSKWIEKQRAKGLAVKSSPSHCPR